MKSEDYHANILNLHYLYKPKDSAFFGSESGFFLVKLWLCLFLPVLFMLILLSFFISELLSLPRTSSIWGRAQLSSNSNSITRNSLDKKSLMLQGTTCETSENMIVLCCVQAEEPQLRLAWLTLLWWLKLAFSSIIPKKSWEELKIWNPI